MSPARTRCLIAAAWILTGVVARAGPKVLTVCEVLGQATHYFNKPVVVVGHLVRSVSPIDHYEFLASPRPCKHPLVTKGHVWANTIQVWTDWETGMPEPPRDRLRLSQSTLAAAIAKGPNNAKLEWMVVYGRIIPLPNLTENCVEGCVEDDAPLLILAAPYNVRELSASGTVRNP